MADKREDKDMLLGRNVPVADEYAPQLLYPIPRSANREKQGIEGEIHGADLWHAYELSWLDARGKPVAMVGRFTVPASSPNMVESKSFKLYLNSLNNTVFDSEADAATTITADISAVAGEPVTLQLLGPDDPSLSGVSLEGDCLDSLSFASGELSEPTAALLEVSDGNDVAEEKLYSHLLRSLCPVTGQPDWATVWLHYRGRALQRESLLRYIISYRQHQEFHEQCIERMFRDISARCTPEFLHIQGFYTRRGGLDINPFRSTDPKAEPLPRLNRQ
jgi:7-cyano-7-deazaguanine reductase